MGSKLKIALIGFGKMGREIDALCRGPEDFEVISVSYKNKNDGLDLEGIKKADVALDFTHKDAVLKNIEAMAKLGKNIVVGTTGWYDNLDAVKKIVEKNKIGLVYGQNFSVGANVFFKLAATSAKLLAKYDYDVYGLEIHHRGKADSPSGTSLKTAGEILKNFPAKKIIQTEKLDRQIRPEELHLASVRGGRNPGLNQIVFDSDADSISLAHQSHSRIGFAQGALLAAEFIKNKKGIYAFEEILEL